MALLYITVGLALLVWAIITAVRGSLYLSTACFFVATCVFPAEFLAVDAAGLTWTVDRLWLVGIAAQLSIRWYRGELQIAPLETLDVALGVFLCWLMARTLSQPLGSTVAGQPATLMHLVNGYLIPFFLYFALRTSRLDPNQLKPALILLGGLGFYLGCTALLEVTGQWGLVFPRFLGDPTIGIHFGRARGPMLQSVRLGVSLFACFVPMIVYSLWLRPQHRTSWIVGLLGIPLLSAAVLATYTRSIWMGLGLTALILVALCLHGLPRRAALFGMLVSCLAIGIIKGPDLVAFKREYSAAETRESTYMRAAFAYVSLQMFRDRPLAGYGFNQFQVYNRPYLSDRSTEIRLESIRGYVHHNSFLSILVDLGLIGAALYTLVGLSAFRHCLQLWRSPIAPDWARGLALVAFALGGVHLIQMAFHEVSFSTIENSFLFACLGLVMAANRQFSKDRASPFAPVGSAPTRDGSC